MRLSAGTTAKRTLKNNCGSASPQLLASAIGANYQSAIQEVLEQRRSELDKHHNQSLIDTRHNATVILKDAILQQIAHDYLELDNWQDVKYVD